MTIAAYLSTFNPVLDDNGDPLAGGKLYFHAPGLTEEKKVFTTPFLDVELSYPVILDDAGRASVWMSGDYDIEVRAADDTLIYTRSNINPDTAGAQTGINLIINGSFEDNTLADNETPDNWTLLKETGGVVELDADSITGTQAFCATSIGNGGANVISENFFEVTGGDSLTVSFFLKSSVADVRNLVQMKWYNAAKTLIQTDNLYDNDASNPTAWTRQIFTATAPALARFGKMQFYAVHPSDATPGQTCYDGVEVFPSSLGGAFASGTVMLFQQATAPSGWTKQASEHDKALRLVNTSGGGAGGVTAFSSIFGASKATAGHSLTLLEMPGHTHQPPAGLNQYAYVDNSGTALQGGGGGLIEISNADTGPVRNGWTNSGQVSPHNHNLSLDIQYVDVIAAAKD